MEKDLIIKALECCTKGTCTKCPKFKVVPCQIPLMSEALALIKELTEEKTELWEERNRIYDDLQDWKEITVGYQKQFEDCYEDKAKLTEENERLRAENQIYAELEQGCYVTGVKMVKADTVRKMQERLKAETITIQDHTGKLGSVVLVGTIDQIANEMLGGENDK